MNLLPLIERELRVALRKRQPVSSRFRTAILCTALALGYILLNIDVNPGKTGPRVHALLCIICLIIAFRTPQLVAGSFADERRNQTLGFLFLSGLSPGEIFLSKLFSAAMIAFNSMLAIFPLLALPFVIGGVSFDLFLATVCGVPNLLLFVLAVTMLASVLAKDDGMALMLSRVFTVVICTFSLITYTLLARKGATPSAGWLWLSPAYCPYLLFTGLKGGTAAYWSSWIFTLAWSCLCLAAAGLGLKRLWRRYQEGTESRFVGRFWQGLSHGSIRFRRRAKKTWMDVNPFVWAAARDRVGRLLGWTAFFMVIAIWLICWALWPSSVLVSFNFLLVAGALNIMLSWIVDYSAAKTLTEPRHDGTYELMLTTPLNPSDIVWGELEALQILFKPVIRATLALEILMLVGGLTLQSWNRFELSIYLGAWVVLVNWTWRIGKRSRHLLLVFWVALNSARPAFAAWKAEHTTSHPLFFCGSFL